jgi:phospholipid/cholesterol/gamma-HCH transport system ATP-binding protein
MRPRRSSDCAKNPAAADFSSATGADAIRPAAFSIESRADQGLGIAIEVSGVVTAPIISADVIVFKSVSLAFDEHVVLQDVSFNVRAGRTTFLLGGSGSGKSTILKLILGLFKPDSGSIFVNGERIDTLPERDLMRPRAAIGMLFQETALFDSLSVAENVGYRLVEETDMPRAEIDARVTEVLALVGLGDFASRQPGELSGGQRRRVAIARAMAANPQILLLDDPTMGLDPITSRAIVQQIITVRDVSHVTPLIVTHHLPDAFYIAEHEARTQNGRTEIIKSDAAKAAEAEFLVLKDARIYFQGRAADLRASDDAYLRTYMRDWVPPL